MSARLRRLALAAVRAIGAAEILVVVGTVALARAAGYFHPAGPWIVTGVVCLALGIALALPHGGSDGLPR